MLSNSNGAINVLAPDRPVEKIYQKIKPGSEPLLCAKTHHNSEMAAACRDVPNSEATPSEHTHSTDKSESLGWRKKTKSKFRKTFSVDLLKRRLPILTWLPTYNFNMFVYDIIAGITVGLTTIPQSIAYAAVAGLPLQYGLYSSIMGVFVYVILGTVKEASVGPTAVMSLMTFSYANEGGPAYAALLTFLAGWIELFAGILNLGFLVEFISAPVISGFCSAAALTVMSTQVKGLFGLKFPGSSFVEVWRGFFKNLNKIDPWDAGLGFCVIVLLLLMRKMTSIKNVRPCKEVQCLRNRFVDAGIWFIATSRNAFAVIAGCLATYFLEKNGHNPFSLTGNIKAGLPSIALPPFSLNRTEGSNNTVFLNFGDICGELGPAIGLIPLIAILEQVAIAKAFSHGKRTDATQEMIALGVGNILGSLLGSMPITASFGRSSVAAASGVRSTMSNIYSGILVLLALAFLMPSLAYIPKAILAAVIITSVVFMVELGEIKHMWKSRRVELIPFSVTFLCCLFINIEYGILIGAGFHLVLLAYMGNRPHPKVIRLPSNDVTEERIIVKADINLYFPGVESFRETLNDVLRTTAHETPTITLDLGQLTEIDYTALKMLKCAAVECHKRETVLHFANTTPGVARSITNMLPSSSISFHPKMNQDELSPLNEHVV